MQRNAALLLLGILVISGCGSSNDRSPEAVTGEFWEAIRARDIEAAAELSNVSSRIWLERMRDDRPIDEILLGEALVGEQTAIVRTSLATSVNERQLHTTFDTHLVHDDPGWKVDTEATQRALSTALFATSMQQIGESVGQGVHEFSAALEEGAAEVSRAIREALEELEREYPAPQP